ncbi:MAG: hypothetical protein J3K34DRAFT_408305 [Monoraphidium minutum]|nr:MAG: hypothetical protein J3K34DRAFT_408305 [Monoraphidium minutum]
MRNHHALKLRFMCCLLFDACRCQEGRAVPGAAALAPQGLPTVTPSPPIERRALHQFPSAARRLQHGGPACAERVPLPRRAAAAAGAHPMMDRATPHPPLCASCLCVPGASAAQV